MKQTSKFLGLALVLGLAILLVGCEPSGDSDTLSTSTTPGPRVEQQAVDNLLQLYGQTLQHEDIDRLQALLQPEPDAAATAPQATHGTFPDLAAFRQTLSTTFRAQTVTHHAILPDTIQMAPDRTQVAFIEVESVADPLSALLRRKRILKP